MTTTGRSTRSSVLRALSSSQRSHSHHHFHHNPNPSSPLNLNLRLRFPNTHKRTCNCSPTTHPGSFCCGYHRRLENEKKKETLKSITKCNFALNLRKTALVNSLAKIGSVEAERFRRCLMATIVKPSFHHIRRRPEFRPRLSRFFALHKDQD